MRKFFDTETRETITETELKAEFNELKNSDPETYNYSFPEYIANCTSKNGVLIEILETQTGMLDVAFLREDIETIVDEMIANDEIIFTKKQMKSAFIDDCIDEIESIFETYDDYRMTDLQSIILDTVDVYRDLGIIEG